MYKVEFLKSLLFFSGKLQSLKEEAVGDIYQYYGSDMEVTRDQFNAEVTRWKHKWSNNGDNEKPQTLAETLDHTSPEFYPGIYVALVTLLTYPVSTCSAERSFSGMKRLKTPLRSTMSKERLSSLAILHIHKHKNVDIDNVVSEFARRKGRRLALCL